MHVKAMAGAALAGLMLAACGPEVVEPPVDAGVLVISEDLNGKAIEVEVGQSFEISLESIPTAGYTWQISAQPAFLKMIGETWRNTIPEQAEPGFTGGNHYIVYIMEVTEAGTGTLKLVEGRPWELEAGETPEARFTLDITARSAS